MGPDACFHDVNYAMQAGVLSSNAIASRDGPDT